MSEGKGEGKGEEEEKGERAKKVAWLARKRITVVQKWLTAAPNPAPSRSDHFGFFTQTHQSPSPHLTKPTSQTLIIILTVIKSDCLRSFVTIGKIITVGYVGVW